MADGNTEAPKTEAPNVQTTQVQGSASVHMENPAPVTDDTEDAVTAESLGVSEAQFAKFYDAETKQYNWENHAKELAWQMQQKGSEAPAQEAPAAEAPTESEIDAAVEKSGLDLEAVNRAIASGEDFPQAEREKLHKIGIDDATIDAVVEGQKALIGNHMASVHGVFGGEENFRAVGEWASKNIDREELQTLVDQMADPKTYKPAANYILQLAQQSGEVQLGKFVRGSNAAPAQSSDAQPYGSDAEFQADVRNPKYQKDPAFRQKVEQRLRSTPALIGNNPRAHTGGL